MKTMASSNRAVFDGDVLAYKSGFSVERRYYSATVNGVQYKFSSLKQAKKDLPKDTEVVQKKEVGGLNQAKMNLVSMLRSVVREFQIADYSIYLSPEDVTKGYRYKAATTAGYKQNRKGEKPVHLKELRRFMVNELMAVIAPDDLEADDLLGMAAGTAMVCSIDKDLLMVPGVHYNLNNQSIVKSVQPGNLELTVGPAGKKKLKGCAFAWFCAQMILGDSVDNIKGIPGMGDVAAYNLLKDCKKAKDMLNCIEKVYKEKASMERFEENKTLLWINQAETFDEILEKY